MTKTDLAKQFINLIDLYGENGELETFNICSEYGVELADSTIDKIAKTENGSVIFYYNENTDDFDSIYAFKTNDLLAFLADLSENLIYTQREFISDYISKKMSNIIMDAFDRNQFVDSVIDYVIDDIKVTADPINWNDSDIDIALARIIIDKCC